MKKRIYFSRLKELIEANPETQNMNPTQLAKFIGVTRQTIYNWFEAEEEPFKALPWAAAEKIAYAFGLPSIESAYRVEDVEDPELMPGAARQIA